MLILCAFAQEQHHKKHKSLFRIKAPSIQYSKPDMEGIMFEDELNSEEDTTLYFTSETELPEVYADTSGIDEDAPNTDEVDITEVADDMKMDCVWVSIAPYYAIWSSHAVNPYKIDPLKYTDTVTIKLYDTVNNFLWSMPLKAKTIRINSDFGLRHYRCHAGVDLDISVGDPVYAAFDGIVRISKFNPHGYGNYVLIRHYNGLETLYGHLSKRDVQVGQLVKAGEIIGQGGNTGRSTGPHLHFEVRYEGNAIDPKTLYNFDKDTIKQSVLNITPSLFDYVKVLHQIVFYRIRSGDNLSSISRKYSVPVSTICRLNKISQRSILHIGQRLRIR